MSGLEWVKPRFDEDRLARIIKMADEYLSVRDSAREEAIRLSREVIRSSSRCITALHKGDLEEARRHLSLAESHARRLVKVLEPYPEMLNSGMANNALSEYAEASIVFGIATGRGLPEPGELGIGIIPYLQGLGDSVGELRRLALELVRVGRFGEAWALLEAMESIYIGLRSIDYPEALAPGIRHKADVARRLIDDTKEMLVDLESRRRLEEAIRGRKEI